MGKVATPREHFTGLTITRSRLWEIPEYSKFCVIGVRATKMWYTLANVGVVPARDGALLGSVSCSTELGYALVDMGCSCRHRGLACQRCANNSVGVS